MSSSTHRLTAIMELRDRLSGRLNNVINQVRRTRRATEEATRSTDLWRDAQGRLRDSMGRYARQSEQAQGTISRFFGRVQNGASSSGSAFSRFTSTANSGTSGLISRLAQLALAFGSVTAAMKLMEMTLGKAMEKEMNIATITAMYQGDKKGANDYINMVSQRAIDSPFFSEKDYLTNSKSFLSMSKNSGQLSDMWGLAERLGAMDPRQGLEGAVFALREMFSGDGVSMVERFEMPKKEINRIKKLDLADQLVEFNKLITKMGFGEDFLDQVSDTGLAYKNQIQEKFSKSFTDMGMGALEVVKPRLKQFNDMLDAGGIKKFTEVGTKALVGFFNTFFMLVDKGTMYARKVKEWYDEWGEFTKPLTKAILAVTAGFFALQGAIKIIRMIGLAIGFLTSPIGLIIASLVLLYAAWDGNWWGFRDTVIEVWNTILPYLLQAWENIKQLFATYWPIIVAYVKQGWEYVSNLFMTNLPKIIAFVMSAWNMIVAIVRTLTPIIWDIVQMVWKGILALISFVMPYIQTLIVNTWNVVLGAFQTVYAYIVEIMPMILELITRVWSILGPIVQFGVTVIWQAVKVAFTLIWNLIAWTFTNIINVIKIGWTIISGLFKAALQLLTGDFSGAWETLKTTTSTAISQIGEFFKDWIAGAWNVGKDFVQGIIDGFLNMWDSLTDTAHKLWDNITSIFGKKKTISVGVEAGGSGVDGTHASGLGHVPYDGYVARLHKGERILTPEENEARNNGARSISIAKLADTIVVREEADIEKIADRLAHKLMEQEV